MLSLICNANSASVSSLSEIVLKDNIIAADVNNRCRYFIDTTNTMSPHEAAQRMAQHIHSLPPLPLNAGYTTSPIWVYATIQDSSAISRYWIGALKNPLLDSVDIYTLYNDSLSLYAKIGRRNKYQWPAMADGSTSFVLPAIKAAPYDLLMRIRTTDVCIVSMDVSDFAAYNKTVSSHKLLFGIYFGALGLIISLNLFLSLFVKISASFTYALYVLSFSCFQFFSSGIVSFVNVDPILIQLANPLFSGFGILFGALFSINFLSLKREKGICGFLYIIFIAFAIIGLCVIAATPISGGRFSAISANIVGLLLVLTCPIAGILLIKRNDLSTTFFTLAVSATALGIIINAGRNFGILSANAFTSHGNLFGSSIGFFILNIALVWRIASIEKEKLIARENAQKADHLATESRFRALQAQINPHFLFNTLNALSEYIVVAPNKAEKLLLKLSDFFRYTLTASKRQIVPLSEEIELVRTYLSIEKARFGTRLEYDIAVDGDATNTATIALLLQPIVENCIKYGIAPLSSGGKIAVDCRISRDNVNIRIKDNGAGFGNVALPTPGTGHGLSSVKERLNLMFGEKSGLACSNNNGALVEIFFPKKDIHEFKGHYS